MLAENLDNLFTQREQKGVKRGKLEGKLEGYAEVIEKQLALRFPNANASEYHAVLSKASTEELNKIALQLLDAETIEDALKL